MTTYTITKNKVATDYKTPNGLYLLIALEYLRETEPDANWDYVIEEREA